MPVFFTQAQKSAAIGNLQKEIITTLGKVKGDFAVAFKMSDEKQPTVLINGDSIFHAASTMKTPVMMEVFRQAKDGKLKMTDKVILVNQFKSIVDSSAYSLSAGDDSDSSLYFEIGKPISIYDLVYRMITRSSNLATNTVIALVDAKNVTNYVRRLGLKQLTVMRGVEDQKAFDRGLYNVTSARDMMMIFDALVHGKSVSRSACDSMLSILSEQEFKTIIPAKLPTDIRIAHKTGSITGVQHDAGIVFLPNKRSYTLVLLSKNIQENEEAAIQAMANVSKMIYDYAISQRN
jgi:beta-lactamase class A